MLTILDHFLFPPLFLDFLPSPGPLPCSPPLILQQILKSPSVTALNQLMQPSSLCRIWKRISPGTNRQPASQPFLLAFSRLSWQNYRLPELLLLQDQEEAEAVASLPYVYPMITPAGDVQPYFQKLH